LVDPIYQRPEALETCLRQGEILSDVVRYRVSTSTIDGERRVVTVDCPYAVVVSQACDLEQQFRDFQNVNPQLPNILLCQLATAEDLKLSPGMTGTSWNGVRKNGENRYHFLEAIPADSDFCGAGLPELGADFKRYFTIPIEELYLQIRSGRIKRRSVLCTPYCEHFCIRFSQYQSRIGLNRQHISV
jgi:hypothetical protein